jgi:hypothetical protein
MRRAKRKMRQAKRKMWEAFKPNHKMWLRGANRLC